MCQMGHNLLCIVAFYCMNLKSVIVNQFQSYFIPGTLSLEVIHCVFNFDGIFCKVAGS